MRLHRATVGYISVHLSLYYSTNGGCRVSPGTPVSLRFVPHAHGSEVRSLPLIITCPFAEPLCSCSPLTGFPAEKKGNCPPMRRIALIRLLLSYVAGTNLGRIAHPQLVTQLAQQIHQPVTVAGGFHADQRRRGHLPVKPFRVARGLH